jgi:intracellular sulfur oxidation DsrE/DsrF family protein
MLLLGPPAQAETAGVAIQVDAIEHMNLVLRQIDNQRRAMPGTPIQVVMIGAAVRALVEGATDPGGGVYAAQLEQLLAEGVQIFACGNTLSTFNLNQDELTLGVEVVPVGLAALTALQLEHGYAYLKL